MAERFLVLGGHGMLGSAWARLLRERDLPHRVFSHTDFDLTRAADFAQINERSDVVINCAAYTQVDLAESNPDAAFELNAEAVGSLARRCRAVGARLIHYSTDYVFDGAGTAPYPTFAPRAPINVYGHSKRRGEDLLWSQGNEIESPALPFSSQRHDKTTESTDNGVLLVRTSWVYGREGKNFVRTIKQLLQTQKELRVVADQRGRPSSADELARNTLRLFREQPWGTFHLTDGGECSWHEFACEIARQLGSAVPIVPCKSVDFPRPAPRPSYSVLDIAGSEALLGALKPWPSALGEILCSPEFNT